MECEIIRINENTWRIEDGGVRLFLLAGGERALLIDSGMNLRNAREIASGLTSLPLSLLNTHADRDHIGSNEQFDEFCMHPAEEPLFRRSGLPGTVQPVREGDVIDLGQRELSVIELPGHTPGSIGLYDEAAGIVFAGDMVSQSPIFFIAGERNEDDFIASMDKILSLGAERIYGCHGPMLNSRDTVEKLKKAAALFRDGKLEPKQSEGPMPGVVYLSEDGVGFRVVEIKK